MRRGLGSKDPPHQPVPPQCANYWDPLTQTQHQQQHRLHRPSARSDLMQHAKERTRDCPGPRSESATQRNVTHWGISWKAVFTPYCKEYFKENMITVVGA